MSEFKEMKFWIGDDYKLSKKVQKILFKLGYVWGCGDTKIENTDALALYAHCDSTITFASSDTFEARFTFHQDYEEINIDWMRTKKPETIELGGKKYIKSEAEEAVKCNEELQKALSKLKPVE